MSGLAGLDKLSNAAHQRQHRDYQGSIYEYCPLSFFIPIAARILSFTPNWLCLATRLPT
jgi:hypothetical protein